MTTRATIPRKKQRKEARRYPTIIFIVLLTCPGSRGFVSYPKRLLKWQHNAAAPISSKRRIERDCSPKTATTTTTTTSLNVGTYGKGDEIWPETNPDPVTLSDSFPNGAIPPEASSIVNDLFAPPWAERPNPALATNGTTITSPSPPSSSSSSQRGQKRRKIKRAISRILRGAARRETDDTFSSSGGFTTTSPSSSRYSGIPLASTCLSLLCLRLVPFRDVLFFIVLGSYLLVLAVWNNSATPAEGPVIRPLPPQGHVPALVRHPLGYVTTHGRLYRLWLRWGAVLGLWAPVASVGWYLYRGERGMARLVARPLFLIGGQALFEGWGKRFMAPLPIRILIPVACNAKRLDPILDWAITGATLGVAGRLLAALNLIYWTANLFAFLLPVATMRYMRAHFFCVEAAEVCVRDAPVGNVAVGLLP